MDKKADIVLFWLGLVLERTPNADAEFVLAAIPLNEMGDIFNQTPVAGQMVVKVTRYESRNIGKPMGAQYELEDKPQYFWSADWKKQFRAIAKATGGE